MRKVVCVRLCGWRTTAVLFALVASLLLASRPATATLRYGPLQLSGNFETQNLLRHPDIDTYQFIQNRNTVRLRVDYDWLQNGRFVDKFDVPFIQSSKLFLLYRGVYDGFYAIAPGGNQIGQTHYDDLVGGPITGNQPGLCLLGPCPASGTQPLRRGAYSRYSDSARETAAWEDTLREAYVDLKLADAPVSFRLGRQQVIWGESDQFRLMDIWNPLDVTWHFQQESWDNIRIPLWMGKALWDIGELGPLSNNFVEVVYNPFDFQPNAKLDFLPRPWAVPLPNPLRGGQVDELVGGSSPQLASPVFNLHGTSFKKGDFHRSPKDASEVGVRFHSVTPQGIEFTTNYLYARGRGVGAASPVGVKITQVGVPRLGTDIFQIQGKQVKPLVLPIDAEIKYPYQHIFGLTANYFEGDFTSAVLRLETAYSMGEPFQTTETSKEAPGSPLGYDRRDVWAGMAGFDRPTWIKWLNSKSTWFLTAQFFWNYTTGAVDPLRGSSGAGESPYFTPASGPGSGTNGLGQWVTGPNAGLVERLQATTCNPGDKGCKPLPGGNIADPSGDQVRRWEHLVTFAATTFYRGGTVVPFIADAWDPVNNNNEVLWNVDFFYTNDFIITVQQKFFMQYGSGAPSDDPWFAGGRFVRRDETGIKLTYQF